MLADPEVGRALRRTVGRLVRDGWLLTRAQRRRIALGTVPLFAVAAVGLTRLVDSAVEGRSAGGPASVAGLLLCCLATALGGWWLTEVPETGSAARRLLRRLRREHADLDPERRPVWQGRDTDTLLTGMAAVRPPPPARRGPGLRRPGGDRSGPGPPGAPTANPPAADRTSHFASIMRLTVFGARFVRYNFMIDPAVAGPPVSLS